MPLAKIILRQSVNQQLHTSMWLTVFEMLSMSPTMYNVALAGKYQRSWNFLILSASHFFICSSNPIGNRLLNLFSECKCCNSYINQKKKNWVKNKKILERDDEKIKPTYAHFLRYIPDNQHDTLQYSSFVILTKLPVFPFPLEKPETWAEKQSVCTQKKKISKTNKRQISCKVTSLTRQTITCNQKFKQKF